MMTKTAHADISAKIAPLDAQDRANAYELGFVKAAQDLGMSEAQFVATYNTALAQVQPRKTR